MRVHTLLIGLTLIATVLAWTKDDHEIFDLVSALEATEGKGTTFYSWLELESSAKLSDITKAYRKKSLELHPDKNPGVKNIQERFARLGVISQILRSPEKRERYNFFYKNGIPTWRGTGYYYSRYRPTLFHTILFLILLTDLFHLLVLRLNYNRDRKRVAYFDSSARAAAGLSGPSRKVREQKGLPVENGHGLAKEGRRRKVKVPMVEGNEGAGFLELVVDGEEVFIPHDDGTFEPLSGLSTPPSITRTWPFTLTLALLQRSTFYLPAATQASLPAFLRPIPETSTEEEIVPSDEEEDDDVDGVEIPAPTAKGRAAELRNARRKKGSAVSTPETTANEDSDLAADDAGVDEGDKRRKKNLGKSGGARRRKMALKR